MVASQLQRKSLVGQRRLALLGCSPAGVGNSKLKSLEVIVAELGMLFPKTGGCMAMLEPVECKWK